MPKGGVIMSPVMVLLFATIVATGLVSLIDRWITRQEDPQQVRASQP
jgi:hypothetical protein